MLLRLPKMIFFDYGRTLLYEREYNALNAQKALFGYVTENPNRVTPEQATRFAEKLYHDADATRNTGYEIQQQSVMRLLSESLRLKYSVSLEEAGAIFWENASSGALMPKADKMLDLINGLGIRSGVISNISFSGQILKNRIDRLLPNNRFEFIIASSDYLVRKPNRLLFELALNKAGLNAKDVWHCGDHPQADIEGAAQVGIFPVWYDNDTGLEEKDRPDKTPPKCSHLHIRDWEELIEALGSAR